MPRLALVAMLLLACDKRPRTEPGPPAPPRPPIVTQAPRLREPDLEFRLFTVGAAVAPLDRTDVSVDLLKRLGIANEHGRVESSLMSSFIDAYTAWAGKNDAWITEWMADAKAASYWAAHRHDRLRRWSDQGWQ
jgi:hypothetical protein